MAQDIGVLGFVRKKVSNPSVQTDLLCSLTEMSSSIPSAAPQNAELLSPVPQKTVTSLLLKPNPSSRSIKSPTCGQPGVFRDHVIRNLVDIAIVGHPTTSCAPSTLPVHQQALLAKIFRAGLACAPDNSKTTDQVTHWILQRLCLNRMSVAAAAQVITTWVGYGDLQVLFRLMKPVFETTYGAQRTPMPKLPQHRLPHPNPRQWDSHPQSPRVQSGLRVKKCVRNRGFSRIEGHSNQEARQGITSGRHLDPIAAIIRDDLINAGFHPDEVYDQGRMCTLPGWFRPTKNWDLLALDAGELVSAIELKSINSSFGNNANNRAEESIGSAFDAHTAFDENLLGSSSIPPVMGYVMIVHNCPDSGIVGRGVRSAHFPIDPDFEGASYLDRFLLLCDRLRRKSLYQAVWLVFANPEDSVSL